LKGTEDEYRNFDAETLVQSLIAQSAAFSEGTGVPLSQRANQEGKRKRDIEYVFLLCLGAKNHVFQIVFGGVEFQAI